jgi:cell division protein FtsL
MTKIVKNEKGFSLDVVLALVAIVIILFVGLLVLYNKHKTVSVGGEWTGQYTVNSPAKCASYGGEWQATLTDKNNNVTGIYSTTTFQGNVTGKVSGKNLNLKAIENNVNQFSSKSNSYSVTPETITINATISKNVFSGQFTGLSCSGNSTTDITKGNISGSLIVKQN